MVFVEIKVSGPNPNQLRPLRGGELQEGNEGSQDGCLDRL